MEFLIYFVLDAVVTGFILWVASKITSVDLFLKETILTVCVASILALIPYIGWLSSIIALFYMLKRFSGATVWPDLILMVIVSKFLSFMAALLLAGLL